MHKKTAVVIGSGVAGLAVATRLAIQGFAVKVYESNGYPGGKLSAFVQDGYRFDAGPSLFTQPWNIEEIFEAAGETIADYFTYHKVGESCRYFFANGKIVSATSDVVAFAGEIEAKLGEPAKVTHKYLTDAKNLYRDIGNVFLNHSLHKRKTWLHGRVFTAVRSLKFSYLFSTLHQYNSKKFKSAEAVQIFNRFATYNGSNPYKAPAMLSLIPHLELNEGVFFPKGGMVSITNALYKLAERKGVQFFFNSPVERIMYTENKTMGVVVAQKNVSADVVISNADVYFTYKNLLRHSGKAKKVLKQERSSSALIFYWGINKSFSQLGLHNIFFSENYKEEFHYIFEKKSVSADPTIYVNITSKEESTDAPAGKENWFVMVNVPANTGQDWASLKKRTRKQVIEKLSRLLNTEVEALIETESIMDPLDIETSTGSFMGSLYGTSSNSKMAAFMRPPNFTPYVSNLYFCGGSVHPGGGIPLCLKSAAITASLIKKDLGKKAGAAH